MCTIFAGAASTAAPGSFRLLVKLLAVIQYLSYAGAATGSCAIDWYLGAVQRSCTFLSALFVPSTYVSCVASHHVLQHCVIQHGVLRAQHSVWLGSAAAGTCASQMWLC
jgi:hypothetical protein